MLTNQEIFTKVRNHLLSQNRRAQTINADGEPLCMYRAPDGAMCAAGCLISYEAYDASLEGSGVHELAVSEMLVKSGIDMDNNKTANLICSLQNMHDNYPAYHWSGKLAEIAANYELVVEA